MKRIATALALLVLLTLSLFLPNSLNALTFRLQEIANPSVDVPGAGVGNFSLAENPVTLGSGNLAFIGEDQNGDQGIYKSIGGVLSVAVDFTSNPPGAGTTFNTFDELITIGGGLIAFIATDSGGTKGIYIFDCNTSMISTVAEEGDTMPPIINGQTFTDFQNIVNLDGTEVAFFANGTGGVSGFYSGNSMGTVVKIGDNSDTEPGGATFTAFTPSSLISIGGTNVAFGAFSLPGPVIGVYRVIGGVISTAADTSTSIPGPMASGTFTTFQSFITHLGSGNIAFGGDGTGGQQGIYRHFAGSLDLVVDKNTAVPGGGSGNFLAFNFQEILSAGAGGSIFVGFDSMGASGVYLAGATLVSILDETILIPGSAAFFDSFSDIVFGPTGGAFQSDDSLGEQGLYIRLNADASLVKIVDRNDPIPGNPSFPQLDFFDFFVSDLTNLNNGDYAFVAEGRTVATAPH